MCGRQIQSRRLSNAVSLRSDDGSSDRPGSSGQLASTRSPGRSLSPSHLETTAERANIYDCSTLPLPRDSPGQSQ